MWYLVSNEGECMKRLKLTLLAVLLTVGTSMLFIATSPKAGVAALTCGNSACDVASHQTTCEHADGTDCKLTGGSCQGNDACKP